mgnify:CR=1 FL=1
MVTEPVVPRGVDDGDTDRDGVVVGRTDALDEALRHTLPVRFRGYSVNFSEPDVADGGTQRMQAVDAGPVRHLIQIETVDSFVRRYLGVDLATEPGPLDWLALPEHCLLYTSDAADE